MKYEEAPSHPQPARRRYFRLSCQSESSAYLLQRVFWNIKSGFPQKPLSFVTSLVMVRTIFFSYKVARMQLSALPHPVSFSNMLSLLCSDHALFPFSLIVPVSLPHTLQIAESLFNHILASLFMSISMRQELLRSGSAYSLWDRSHWSMLSVRHAGHQKAVLLSILLSLVSVI